MTQITPAHQQRMSDQLDADMAQAERTGEHVWIVAAAYRISADDAARVASGRPLDTQLGADNVISLEPGCFRCEEPLSPRLLHRRCRGEAAGQ